MDLNTIDLSGIEPDYYPGILNEESAFMSQRRLRFRQTSLYASAKRKSDQLFMEWFRETNQKLIEDIDEFVKSSMGLSDKKVLFPDAFSNVIHPATVVLGLQQSDHLPTIDMIEEHMDNNFKDVFILRLKENLTKKSQLLEVLQDFGNSKNIMVIVEQTEIMQSFLLEVLINALHYMLQNKSIEKSVILFCMSGTWKSISRLLPISVRNRMKPCIKIVKEPSNLFRVLTQRLVEAKELPCFLGPKLIKLIDEDCCYRDRSITNLKYLFQSSLIAHFLGSEIPLASLPRKELQSLLKERPNFGNILLGDEFQPKKLSKASRNDADSLVIQSIGERISSLKDNHEFICIQLNYYLQLLRDEVGEMFPANIIDLYHEVFHNDDMGHSVEFVNAISKIREYSGEGLIRRLESVVKSHRKVPEGFEKQDVYYILSNYYDRLSETESVAELAQQLRQELLNQAKFIKNPSLFPLFKTLYNEEKPQFLDRIMPATRYKFKKIYEREASHFDILLGLIQEQSEEINLDMLYGDFRQKVEELESRSKPTEPKQEESIKVRRVSKRAKSETKKEKPKTPKKEQSKKGCLSDEIMRSMFFDLIETLRHHGIIVSDNRKSRKDSLKKNAWLCHHKP